VFRVAIVLLLVGALPASAEGPRAWDLNGETKAYSQGSEELVIRHFFADREGGVFVDVGCFHWKQHSTTYYLEAHLGWSGVGIDALPWLRAGYEKNRKATRFFNYLVGAESGGTETLFAAGPLSTTDEARIDAWMPGKEKQPIEVEKITLDDLLTEAGVAKIDFLSMDIEGGEAGALEGFDIAKYAPGLVCIEIAPANLERVQAYFAKHDYELLEQYRPYDAVNWYYAPASR
jgi:FkbM family methyltransferase